MPSLSSQPDTPRAVAAWPCQSICVWAATGQVWRDDSAGGLPVFACRGCGSEWVRTEPWTPIDAAGAIPEEIRAERSRSR